MFSSIVSTSQQNLSYFSFRNSNKVYLDLLVFVRLRQIVQETEQHQMYDVSTRTIKSLYFTLNEGKNSF